VQAGSNFASGIGYFTANGSNFPFEEGLLISTGLASDAAGQYTGTNTSGGTGLSDTEVSDYLSAQGVNTSYIYDVAYAAFDIVPVTDTFSFNYIMASEEYGAYQCYYGDLFVFLLKDLTTGEITNLALVPGTGDIISTTTIHDTQYNTSCPSENVDYFGAYNATDPANSNVNFKGQTVPMTATGYVTPGHQYSLKIAVADYGDAIVSSAVFIEANSFNFGSCADNATLRAFVDANNNGVKDSGEAVFTEGSFHYDINGSGTPTQGFSPAGFISIIPENTTDTFDFGYTVNPEYVSYFTSPVGFSNISIAEGSGTNTYYFPIVPTGLPYADVEADIIPTGSPRPGFPYHNLVSYTNNGFLPISGTLTFTTSNPSAASVTATTEPGALFTAGGGFTYAFTDLQPQQTKNILATLDVTDVPIVNAGDILSNTVTATIDATDAVPANNAAVVSQIVVNSVDPNDKTESHGGHVYLENFTSDDYLYYTIRFQNTGTANAVNIKITDELDSQLDASSIRLVAASSDYYSLERNGSQLTWKFNNINLPPSSIVESASHGFVTFKVKPNNGYAAGTEIPNTASIYFDGNDAIETNSFNTVFMSLLGNDQFQSQNIKVYPNPSNNVVTISTGNSRNISRVVLTDMLGKTITDDKAAGNSFTLDVASIPIGMYMLRIESSSGASAVKKLIIE
jgi:fimbrial isopeptide formation D2 family protein